MAPTNDQYASTTPRRFLLVGNPNAGKTTLYNALTGSRARVGNYPGITVESRRAVVNHKNVALEIVDLPGTYSLTAHSPEEKIVLDALHGNYDGVVVATSETGLDRGLYLALQVIELGLPVLVALTLCDEADGRLIPDRLQAALGVPVVRTYAKKRHGTQTLLDTLSAYEPAPANLALGYSQEVLTYLKESGEGEGVRKKPVEHAFSVRGQKLLALFQTPGAAPELNTVDPDTAQPQRDQLCESVATTRYAFIEQTLVAVRPETNATRPWHAQQERIDRVLTHPIAGLAIFIVVMLLVFQMLFAGATPAADLIDATVARLGDALEHGVELGGTRVLSGLPAGALRDLLVQGVIGGVGSVLVFTPQIALLFFLIGALEDSGYLARAAFLMDRIMRAAGLPGKAFVPLLSGYACAVPAVLATRTLEKKRDRLLTILTLPLMSCSARLPVYVLISAVAFAGSAPLLGFIQAPALVLIATYVGSAIITIAAVFVLSRTGLKGSPGGFVLELPPYRWPNLTSLVRQTWLRTKSFLVDAGSIILALSLVLWALLSYPKPDQEALRAGLEAGKTEATVALETSAAGRVTRFAEPVLEPLGFDSRIGVGLVAAFAAREVFVSSLGIVFGREADDETGLIDALRNARKRNGEPLFSSLTALSLIVFFVFACQCMSTLAAARRETGSWRYPIFMFAYMTSLAVVASFAVYQCGRLLGYS